MAFYSMMALTLLVSGDVLGSPAILLQMPSNLDIDMLVGPTGALVILIVILVWMRNSLKEKDAKIDEINEDRLQEKDKRIAAMQQTIKALTEELKRRGK
ncbi:MAG: hypothetical protein MJH10_11890 [Epibacterium sp.]|nr:hypothetical protein [Epibacterium sp.]NQX74248.1 hypothetical protein [Epibacterium sp.]